MLPAADANLQKLIRVCSDFSALVEQAQHRSPGFTQDEKVIVVLCSWRVNAVHLLARRVFFDSKENMKVLTNEILSTTWGTSIGVCYSSCISTSAKSRPSTAFAWMTSKRVAAKNRKAM